MSLENNVCSRICYQDNHLYLLALCIQLSQLYLMCMIYSLANILLRCFGLEDVFHCLELVHLTKRSLKS